MSGALTRRPEKALTALEVKNATKQGKYFDGHGLYLRVDANGSKFWVQRIVIRGKRSELGLGSAALVTLAEARAMALENRKLARSGGDPLQAKREALKGAWKKGYELGRSVELDDLIQSGMMGLLDAALREVIAAEPLERKLMKAWRAGQLRHPHPLDRIDEAREAGVIAHDEAQQLRSALLRTAEICRVDEFDATLSRIVRPPA
jgi:hypothetical protein